MNKEKKYALDGILKKTDVWKYIQTLAATPIGSVNAVKSQLERKIAEKYEEGTALREIPFQALYYECDIVADELTKELSDFAEYCDYCKTFSKREQEVMYETDVLDSKVAARL